ncbi:thiamine phosphate synthase [Pilimelia columellifera]|uniref:Thiamine-phosphate synthase n=1 Tax=Pilimelia columellifera subsp. columellifera TaxID=706583 RepID=A0ABN3NEJ5_9ACTN
MPPVGRLHLITDTRPGRDPLAVLRAALTVPALAPLGPLMVQVRVEDDWTDRQAYELAQAAVQLCAASGAVCLVNDRVDVALAVGAAGVHLGADDLPVEVARRLLGPGAVIGATARGPDGALAALEAGASYLGVGPAYPTTTKDGLPDSIGPSGVAAVAAATRLPVVAIGGVTADRAPGLLAAGAYGVAVVGAVSAAADPAQALARLVSCLSSAFDGSGAGAR